MTQTGCFYQYEYPEVLNSRVCECAMFRLPQTPQSDQAPDGPLMVPVEITAEEYITKQKVKLRDITEKLEDGLKRKSVLSIHNVETAEKIVDAAKKITPILADIRHWEERIKLHNNAHGGKN